ncbi:SDR family NAD(P)-dependent oxidoreductase [Maribellus sediminis]|uniref:SDR family NAD(P)-dependent oxidoreductase n=1 Tax=Maribellus sediminis TaxID=2696285 RepID=UPI001430004E|nr:SDR family NAD(P)-dependent oxidoreductase [Maribellus sediminis]
MNRIALITGATSGIGEATAEILAQNNFDLILTGRRKDRLTELQARLQKDTSCEVVILAFDVRDKAATESAFSSLSAKWKAIDVLINNAGLAVGMETIDEGVVDDWERMIDTNIKGLLYITRLVSPLMVQRKSGHIINLSSIAGKEAYAMGNVYCATKHAVQGLTQGMRIDLVKHGIKVSSLAPGAVETEFSMVRFKGDKSKADGVYKGFVPLYANDIAETILFMVTRPAHVNIDDVLIMPTSQAFSRIIHKEE